MNHLTKVNPFISPYVICSNNAIIRTDPDGMIDDWFENEGTLCRDNIFGGIGKLIKYHQGDTSLCNVFNYQTSSCKCSLEFYLVKD